MASLRAVLLAAAAVLLATCSDSAGPPDVPDPDADADGDTITDVQEGVVDTDGDGVPDSTDTDSDGDGLPDYREAGDSVPATPPVDSDSDGVPDFRDTDSDGNGRADGVDGTGDFDGDGRPDFQDLDDDGDGILDRSEIGAGGVPVDTDGDGRPDFQDDDSDADGLPDRDEGAGDRDGDGVGDWMDPRNDASPPALTFTAISTTFNSPIGIDYHEPTDSVVMSVNYATGGTPSNFERVELDGTHVAFSSYMGMTDEVKIATVRSGTVGGFVTGDLFVGNGRDGEIVRISDNGATVMDPWVSLPGDANGLMRGSLYIDRTGVWGGDLIAVTTVGQVWRITAAGTPTLLASVGVHLEGMITVPPYPARFGPLAGKIIAGAEAQGLLYAFDATGAFTTYSLGVAVEDIDVIMDENYFGVSYGTSRLLGVPREAWSSVYGDILLAQESVATGTTGLFRIYWDGTTLSAQPFPLAAGSTDVVQWEHVTFAAAGIAEIP